MKFNKSALRKISPTLFALVLASQTVTGQESTTEYEEIFITAARTERNIQDTLASATIFSAKDIEISQATDLADLFAGTAGLDVTDSGGRGALTSVGIRGFTSSNTLVLVDGVRTSSATSGSTAFQHIPIENIDRVEIVRGPKSALYGADAVGGVIQIFTKTETAPYVRLGVGSHGTLEGAAGASYNKGGTQAAISLSYEDSVGFSRVAATEGANADDDGYDEFGLSLTASQETGVVRLYTNHLLSTGNTEIDSGGEGDSSDYFNLASSFGATISLGEQLDLDINVGYAADETETFSLFPSEFNTNRLSANAKLDYRLTENSILIFGYDFYDDRVDSTASFTESSRDNQAAYAQYLGDVGGLSFQAGVRFDDNETFGDNTTGNLTLGYSLANETTISLGYGTAFRAPTFNDLFFPETDFSFPGFPFIFFGNSDLEPEESETIELMARGTFDAFSWSVSLYQTNADNLIVGSVEIDAELGLNTALNIDEAEIEGVEVTLGYEIAGWHADAELSYISPEDENTGERLERADRQAKVSLSKQFDGFNISASLVAQGDRISNGTELGGYGIVNLRTQHSVTENLTISASIRNFFDKEYTLISGFGGDFNTEDRAGSLSATYRF